MSTTQEEPTLHELASRLAQLEQTNARLHEELLTLRAERARGGEQVRTLTRGRRPGRSEQPDRQTTTETGTRKSRRRLLAKGLAVAAATIGGVAALQRSSPVAYADNIGNFDSTDGKTPAVTAKGTNGSSGVHGQSDTSVGINGFSTQGYGVNAIRLHSEAIHAEGFESVGVHAVGGGATSTTPTFKAGVFAEGGSSVGVYGTSTGSNSAGVPGISSNAGVYGSSDNYAVYGTNTASNIAAVTGKGSSFGVAGFGGQVGVYGQGPTAGYFKGDVSVTGTLSKGGGSFKIDHPLDPAHKYLLHSFVESPDMKNIYDGVVTLDAHGQAQVSLPAWFDTLNTTFRYQLTAIGTSAPDLYIAQTIQDNHFTIAGGKAGMQVCWMVTGIRQDAWAKAYRIPVEQDKPKEEQGFYLHPELYGQSEHKSIMQVHQQEPTSPVLPAL